MCAVACNKEENKGTEYTVTFRYATSGSTLILTQTVKEGERLTPPRDTVYHEGFRLQGWSRQISTPPDLWNFNADVVTQNRTLYAYYKFPVIFDYTGKAANDTVWQNSFFPTYQPIVAPDTTPNVDLFVFDAWYKDADLTAAWNFANDRVSTPYFRVYARWATAFNVTFNTLGGNNLAPVQVRENTLLLRPEKPINPNPNLLYFAWYRDADHTELWNFPWDRVEGDMTLYVRWYNIEVVDMYSTPVHLITCDNRTIRVLNEDLPGPYTWTKHGENTGDHYNPCPEGWEVPTESELICIMPQLHSTFVLNRGYWSRERGVLDAWGRYQGRYAGITNEGTVSGPLGVDSRFGVRCVKYD